MTETQDCVTGDNNYHYFQFSYGKRSTGYLEMVQKNNNLEVVLFAMEDPDPFCKPSYDPVYEDVNLNDIDSYVRSCSYTPETDDYLFYSDQLYCKYTVNLHDQYPGSFDVYFYQGKILSSSQARIDAVQFSFRIAVDCSWVNELSYLYYYDSLIKHETGDTLDYLELRLES